MEWKGICMLVGEAISGSLGLVDFFTERKIILLTWPETCILFFCLTLISACAKFIWRNRVLLKDILKSRGKREPAGKGPKPKLLRWIFSLPKDAKKVIFSVCMFILAVLVFFAITTNALCNQKARPETVENTLPVETLVTEYAPLPDITQPTKQTFRMKEAECLESIDLCDWKNESFWNQDKYKRKDIKAIQFCSESSKVKEIQNRLKKSSWDVSAKSDGTVIACLDIDGTLWITADGIIELSENSSYLFAGFSNVESIAFNSSIDSSYTTDMSHMFALCKSLTAIDLENLNTGNVKNMFRMFHDCKSMKDFRLTKMDTSQVTNMGNMFSYCSSLTALDVSNFATPNLVDMGNMFHSCENLQFVDVSHFDTSKVQKFNAMFYECKNLKSVDISNWAFSSAKGMCNVFYGSGISEIRVSDWPDQGEANIYNFMSPGSTINGVRWDEFSKSNLTE